MGAYPDVKDFIDSKATDFPTLKTTYTRGAPPTIKLKDKNGKDLDSIRIDSWNKDTIVDFFKERLA